MTNKQRERETEILGERFHERKKTEKIKGED
jgi:hypothetical protein